MLISTDLWGRGLDVQQVPVGQNQTYTCGQMPPKNVRVKVYIRLHHEP